jgi:hypothetical protein
MNAHVELLQRIGEVSSLCTEVSEALQSMIDQHGGEAEKVASARALQSALSGLKRELVRHYLDCRILEAAQVTHAMNN